MVTWLITGGAGYIGSHVVLSMLEAGLGAVVLDDLSSGRVDRVPTVPLILGSVLDRSALQAAVSYGGLEGIVHLAGKKTTGGSVRDPLYYYGENVEGLRRLLTEATAAGVAFVVFSSSAAVYGAPDVEVVSEDTACKPITPYGNTKLIGEWMIMDVAKATDMRFVILRYFNVTGTARAGLADRETTNLIPMVLEKLQRGEAPCIFGADYETPDGTCVRDFVHVADVASAHVAALTALRERRAQNLTLNVGRGEGVSVGEIVSSVRALTGTASTAWAEPLIKPRRVGDAARVVASTDAIVDALGWHSRYGLDEMIASAWAGWRVARGGQ